MSFSKLHDVSFDTDYMHAQRLRATTVSSQIEVPIQETEVSSCTLIYLARRMNARMKLSASLSLSNYVQKRDKDRSPSAMTGPLRINTVGNIEQ